MAATVTSTASGANAALSTESTAMAAVQARVNSFSTSVANGVTALAVDNATLSSVGSISTQEQGYLNSTGLAALTAASAALQVTSQAAATFATSAQSSTQLAASSFGAAAVALSTQSVSLDTQTQAAVSAVGSAHAYLNSDVLARATAIASANAYVAQALQLLASLDVAGGVEAMANASVELQAASSAQA